MRKYLSNFSSAMIKYHNKNSLRREGLPHTSGVHFIMESEKQELEAAGHIATLDRKKRASSHFLGVYAQLPFSILHKLGF